MRYSEGMCFASKLEGEGYSHRGVLEKARNEINKLSNGVKFISEGTVVLLQFTN